MLNKYMVQSLRDLALEQLPDTKALSKKLYIEHGNSRAALQAVAWAPTLLICSPLSTSLEVLAGRLLALVGKHPYTHTEYLIDKWDSDDELCTSVEDAVLWAEQDRPYIEEALLETARQLCEISGANLPLWMSTTNGQFVPAQTAPPAPVQTAHKVPALVVQAKETKEQRQDRRLEACTNAGLCFESYKGRLPDGVGDVACREGVKRQSFSQGVKAALERRGNAKREGVTVHRT